MASGYTSAATFSNTMLNEGWTTRLILIKFPPNENVKRCNITAKRHHTEQELKKNHTHTAQTHFSLVFFYMYIYFDVVCVLRRLLIALFVFARGKASAQLF